MRSRKSVRILLSMIFTFTLIFPTISVAEEIILYPGWISGSITTNLTDHRVSNIFISASGNGNSSSKNVNEDNYTLTVQGGDWDYNVNAIATVCPAGKAAPYTQINFSHRSFPIHMGETVVNNYSASGAIRFKLSITGDIFTSWSVSGSACVNPAGKDKTFSVNDSASSSNCPDGIWYMPVVPNEKIGISAAIPDQSLTTPK